MMILSVHVRHITGCLWEYHPRMYENRVIIPFTTKLGEKPKTGDQIVNNQLVKAGA